MDWNSGFFSQYNLIQINAPKFSKKNCVFYSFFLIRRSGNNDIIDDEGIDHLFSGIQPLAQLQILELNMYG